MPGLAVDARAAAILRRLPETGHAAEIGVLVGTLSGRILKARPGVRLLMIDNWEVEAAQPEAYKATRDVHAHHDRARVRLHEKAARAVAAAYPGRATVIKDHSDAAARRIADGSLDLVFIDADHSYDGCRADIRAWYPKIKPGGWIGGHDYENPDPSFAFGVTQAVDDWAWSSGRPIETDLNFTWWSQTG